VACGIALSGPKRGIQARPPFPAGVLPYLPEKITGPLFQGDAPHPSKRLNRLLRDTPYLDTKHAPLLRATARHPVVLPKKWVDKIGL
jgi:hypothetical protein